MPKAIAKIRSNVSGGPHDVSFWPDSIPPGTRSRLASDMPARTGAAAAAKLGPIVGPLVVRQNDTYTISFAGLTPHLALGMKGTAVGRVAPPTLRAQIG